MKILLIDDNEDITTMLSKYFAMKGHECHVSNDGRNGLDLMEAMQFHVILLDLAMPDFSGRDVVDYLYDNGSIRNYLIVSLTASSVSDDDISYLVNKGIHSVLRKPIDPDALLEYLIKVTTK